MKWDGVFSPPTELERMREAKQADEGHFMYGGYRPPESDETPWPPKRAIGLSLFKRLDALLRNGRLIWLRDYDETQSLAVAVGVPGDRYTFRIWPCYRRLDLNEDGTVTSKDDKAKYVRHWIWAGDTDKVYMLMENSEKYAEPFQN